MNRSAMSLDQEASLSRPNVIREDLPKHHLVIIKVNIPYNHRKEYKKSNKAIERDSLITEKHLSAKVRLSTD